MKAGVFIQKILLLCITTLALGGCMSTAGEWFSFSSNEPSQAQEKDKNQYPTSLSYQQNGKPQSKAMQNTIAISKAEETDKKLNSLIKEWDAVKSDINRIIELEAELGFIVEELNKQDSLNSLNQENIALVEYTPESMPEVNSGDPIHSDQDFVSTAQEIGKGSNTVVGQAAPIINVASVLEVDSQFSSQSSKQPTNRLGSNISSENRLQQNEVLRMDNKFSQISDNKLQSSTFQTASIVGELPSDRVMNNKGDANNTLLAGERCSLSSIDKSIGIHLISLKDEKKVNKAANELLNKFSAQLCGTYKVNNVLVKGEQYYSVRFGPYTNREEAQKACSSIRAEGQYCGLADFVGQTM